MNKFSWIHCLLETQKLSTCTHLILLTVCSFLQSSPLSHRLATGPALHENFLEIAPLGVPVEFEFDMNAFGSAIETKPENILATKGRVLPSSLAPSFGRRWFRTPNYTALLDCRTFLR